MKYVIKDWAGNYVFERYIIGSGTLLSEPTNIFNSFEDAQDFLYSKVIDEDDLQDYFIEEYLND